MRRTVLAVVLVCLLWAGLAAWRSPTAALVSLKLAFDHRDLSGVARALDYRAITDAALARLVQDHAEEPVDVRLVLRGQNAWVPAVSSARTYLRIRLEREVERLVEDPERPYPLTWEDLRHALATLRRSGTAARFRLPGRAGEEYVVRMRQAGGRWRIVSVDRDGEPLLLGPPDDAALAAAAANGDADAGAPAAEEDAADEPTEARLAALVDESSALVRATPPPRPRGRRSPFVRRLDDGAWTIQVVAMLDAMEADLEREWWDAAGEPAYVEAAQVRGATWHRVRVGRYATRAEAERSLVRLRDRSDAEVTARR